MKRIIKKIRQKKNKSRKVGARHKGGTCSREDKIRVIVKDREAWHATVYGVAKNRT